MPFQTYLMSNISFSTNKNIYCRKYKRKIKIWSFPTFVKKKTLGISFVKSSWENFPAWIIKITVLSGKSSFHVFVFCRRAVKKAITLCRKMGKSPNYDVANFKQSLNDMFNYLEFFSTIDTALYYSTHFLSISAFPYYNNIFNGWCL